MENVINLYTWGKIQWTIATCNMHIVHNSRGLCKGKCIFLLNKWAINTIQTTNFFIKNNTSFIMYPEEPIVYTEHPNTSEGVLYAWTNHIPIQVIIIRSKNLVIDTSTFICDLYCYRSEIIRSEYFNTFEEFYCYVSLIWTDSYDTHYNKFKLTE
jgi:hypothetical protein